MKNWKKVGSLALVALLAIVPFSACNKTTGDVSTSGTSSTAEVGSASETSAAPVGEATTIRVLGPETTNKYYKFAERDKYNVWHELDKKFKEANLAMEFEIVPDDQYQVVIQTRMASGTDLPDFASITKLDETIALNLANRGILLPVNQIIDEYSQGPAKEFFDVTANFAAKATTAADGNRYWVTNVQYTTYEDKLASTCMMIAIREDWLKALNLETPTTAEEFKNVMKEFRTQDANGNGQVDEILAFNPVNFNSGIAQWFGLVPGELFGISPDGKEIVSPWKQEGIKDYFKYLNELYQEGIIDVGLVGAPNDELQDQVTIENKVGAIFTYPMQGWLESMTNAEGSIYLPIGPLASVDTVTPVSAVEPPQLVWHRWGVTKNAEDKKEAIARMLDVFYSPEYEILCAWGIEGEIFEYDANGNIKELPDTSNAFWEPLAQQGIGRGQNIWGNAMLPRLRFAPMEIEIEMIDDYKAKYQKEVIFYEPNSPNDVTPYLALPTEEQLTRKSEILVDLKTYSSELITQLIMGEKSVDDWDSYMAQFEALGLKELLEIEQDMLNRYNQS